MKDLSRDRKYVEANLVGGVTVDVIYGFAFVDVLNVVHLVWMSDSDLLVLSILIVDSEHEFNAQLCKCLSRL